jgi:hypothetical protein
LTITDGDVERLIIDDVLWRGYRHQWLEQQKGEYPRFQLYISEIDEFYKSGINFEYTYGLFFENWTNVMIVRSFLLANDYDIQILSDESGGDWCILTNYERLYRRKRRAKGLDATGLIG